MKPVVMVFQEFRYEVLYVLSNEEGGTNFAILLDKAAKVVKRPKEDLDTGHGLVKAVYDLVELDLVEKSGPDTYLLIDRGNRVMELVAELGELERRCLSEPFTIETIQILATMPNMSIYRLKTRVSVGDKVEEVADKLKDAGLAVVTESPMDTHMLVALTPRGEEAFRVIGLVEEELQRRGPQKPRKIRIL